MAELFRLEYVEQRQVTGTPAKFTRSIKTKFVMIRSPLRNWCPLRIAPIHSSFNRLLIIILPTP